MTGIHLLVPTICAMLGLTISSRLLLLLIGQKDRGKEWAYSFLLGMSVFLVYAGTLASAALSCDPFSSQSWQYLISNHITFSAAAFIPSIILMGWESSSIFKDETPVGAGLVRTSLVSATAIVAFCWLKPSSYPEKLLGQLVIANALLFLFLGFRALLRHKISAQLQFCLVLTRAFYLIGILVALATPVNVETSSLGYTSLVLIKQLGILLGILGSFVFVARLRFADIFVKSSIRIVGVGIVATMGAVGLDSLRSSFAIAGRGYMIMIEAFVLFVLIGLAIKAAPAIDTYVERRLLQQADLKRELEEVRSLMVSIDNEERLLSWIDQQLAERLQLTTVHTARAETLPFAVVQELSSLGDVFEPQHCVSSRNSDNDLGNIEMLVPIMVDGGVRYVMAIWPGIGRRTLLSDEVQFLRAIAQQLGARIHQIVVERLSRQQALRESLLRNQLTEAELRALRAQVNPHFLFNSLNTIADLIVTNQTSAERMTLRLAGIFRHVLAQTDRQFMTLREEFDFLRNYLQIEQERFGDRLSVRLDLDPGIAHENVATLLLQPIVENALKHGLAPKGGKGLLQISATQSNHMIELSVADNGIGFDAPSDSVRTRSSLISAKGVGLTNTAARLRTIYGTNASLNIESAPMRGCRVMISYPFEEKQYAMPRY